MTALNPSEIGIRREDLDRAFMAALLLTASVEGAESAVSVGIAAMDEHHLSGETLLRESIRAALADETVGCRRTGLPSELWRVSCLPRSLRSAFVLRILLNLPRAVCARMLDSHGDDVDIRIHEAVRVLANFDG